METKEKLIELKKAYADIILNISKEAAARVMVTERKAARYQHELNLAKEEALRMMVRLKGMMDSKISEAQATSLKQQMKIDELEAQLQEAEDIVKDLREELRESQSKLDTVRNENFYPKTKLVNFNPGEIPLDSKFCSYQPSTTILPPKSPDEFAVTSDFTITCPSQIYESFNCSNLGNQDLPSIISRSKEPGLYRNGCTQRILACDRNLLAEEFSRKTDKLKHNLNNTELSDGEVTFKAPTKFSRELQKKLFTSIKARQSFVQEKRKRSTIQRKVKPFRLLGTDQLPELSVKTDPAKGNAHFYDNSLKDEPNIQLECTELSGNETNLLEIENEENVLTDVELIEEMVPETGIVENFPFTVCEVDVEVVNIPLSNLAMNLSDKTEELPDQSLGERVIKYTFQRKRKRQSSSDSNGNMSLETEKKNGDKLNGDQKVEQPKCSSIAESSRESRRLAQVARQLISLSERKW